MKTIKFKLIEKLLNQFNIEIDPEDIKSYKSKSRRGTIFMVYFISISADSKSANDAAMCIISNNFVEKKRGN